MEEKASKLKTKKIVSKRPYLIFVFEGLKHIWLRKLYKLYPILKTLFGFVPHRYKTKFKTFAPL